MKDAVIARAWTPTAIALGHLDGSVTGPSSRRFQMYEYAYYFIVFYALMGTAVGISVGSLGIAMHLVLALLCVFRLGPGVFKVYRPLTSIILCSVWFVFVQVLVHGSPLTNPYIRPFLSFLLALLIAKSLFLRPGFLQRASIAIFIIGLTVLPFLNLDRTGGGRAGLSEGALANSNDLAYWFGFCAVAFMVRGLETRRNLDRWLCGMITLFSLFIVGLTVGRGALGAFALAGLIAFRKRLQRGFLPVLGLLVLAGGAFAYGLFDHAIERYAERGAEGTGRLEVWPLVVPRILASPLSGVPASQFGTTLPSGYEITPHDGLLLISLGGGLVALVFFLAHWVRCFRGALWPALPDNPDVAYLLPLLVYSFIIMLQASEAFISTWCEVIVCACLHNLAVRHGARISSVKARLTRKRRSNRELVTAKP